MSPVLPQPRKAAKTVADIVAEWDRIASLRHEQIASGRDTTYLGLLLPTVVRMSLAFGRSTRIVDVGCGTGFLTRALSENTSGTVLGVDPSSISLQIAQSISSNCKNVDFYQGTVEDLAKTASSEFDVAVANMTLMDCLSLDSAVGSICKVLKPGGSLIATITHPWFWPRYWRYESEPWFNYLQETVIEAPFAITAESSEFLTTHVHRPLEMYVRVLASAGLRMSDILEPMPDADSQKRSAWEFPRYLAFTAAKV